MRCWLIAIGLLGCLTAAHAGSPVWAIEGKHNTVYLAGSVHLLRTGDASLPAAFDRAYEDAEVLVMELDLDDLDPLAAVTWMLERGSLAADTSLREVIGEERHRRVAAEVERLGLSIEALQRLEPWALALQLLQMQYLQLGFDPEQGVEKQLERRARRDGKEIRGLETLTEQLGLLDALSYEDQARFLELTVTEMHEVEQETDALLAAWREGDIRALASMLSDEYDRFPGLYDSLVTERNQRWLPQIEKLLQDEDDYLVVVGALHLVGDEGLLELMRRRSLQPRPLQ